MMWLPSEGGAEGYGGGVEGGGEGGGEERLFFSFRLIPELCERLNYFPPQLHKIKKNTSDDSFESWTESCD